MKNNFITTDADFEYFKKRVEFYIDLFNLNSWDRYYEHTDEQTYINEDELALAGITHNSLTVTFVLNKNWGVTKVDKDELDRTAYHEVLEVLLAEFQGIMAERSFDYQQQRGLIHTAKHRIIHTLDKIYRHFHRETTVGTNKTKKQKKNNNDE